MNKMRAIFGPHLLFESGFGSGCLAGRNFLNGGIFHFEGAHLRRAFQEVAQCVRNGLEMLPVIVLGMLPALPETDLK